MSWNHRVMKHIGGGDADWYAIHEVYYDEAGEVNGWTENEIAPGGETLDDLRKELEMFKLALDKPILDYEPEEPTKQ